MDRKAQLTRASLRISDAAVCATAAVIGQAAVDTGALKCGPRQAGLGCLALWIIGVVLCLLGLSVATLNWSGLFLNIRNRRRGIPKGYSQGPVIGPLLGYLGLTTLPVHKSPWVWFVLLIDPSTLILVGSLPILFRQPMTTRDRGTAPPGAPDLGKPPEGMRERLSRVREYMRKLAPKRRR